VTNYPLNSPTLLLLISVSASLLFLRVSNLFYYFPDKFSTLSKSSAVIAPATDPDWAAEDVPSSVPSMVYLNLSYALDAS